MKVKLITQTPNMLNTVFIAARTCYSETSPINMWNDNNSNERMINLLDKVLGSGHLSPLEHTLAVFAVEGVSRNCLAQLSRHRFIQLSVQSQRYVEIKENQDELFGAYSASYNTKNYTESKIFKILDKYFVEADNFSNVNGYYYALDNYLEAISMGEKPEDARRFLPGATKTNMIVSCNMRELSHICSLRCCNRSQAEIRKLIGLMRDEVVKNEPWLTKYLQPACEQLSYCPELNSCGRKPKLKEVLKND